MDAGTVLEIAMVAMIGALFGGLLIDALVVRNPGDRLADAATGLAAVSCSLLLVIAYRAISGRGYHLREGSACRALPVAGLRALRHARRA